MDLHDLGLRSQVCPVGEVDLGLRIDSEHPVEMGRKLLIRQYTEEKYRGCEFDTNAPQKLFFLKVGLNSLCCARKHLSNEVAKLLNQIPPLVRLHEKVVMSMIDVNLGVN